MTESSKATGCSDEMLDYTMSEKFGLDWQKHDAKRIMAIMEIMSAINKKRDLDSRKNSK